MQTSVEGGNSERMVAPFENTRPFAISPDHSQFLIGQFTRHDDEMPLWLRPVQGGEPRRVRQATGHDPAWSPDGTQIVFVRGQNLNSIHRDGTQLRPVAHADGHPRGPARSPDGENIRFTIDLGEYGTQSVWEMSADGNGLHPILANGTQPSHQSAGNWTADGKYFLFSSCERCHCNLWAMRGAGSGVRTSSRAVAGGRKAGKSSPDPTDLFTNRFSNHCARIEAWIFDKKHAIFLFAQSRHDRGSEG
jgi:dipeptidyl aminopeptidase/acylaminoacyl peptidase